ncbi:MAG TPA: FecR family protein [Chthoniobacterales bacterium]|nr:FecR family protein [Chthoniobacterales bacterium]
MKDANSRTASVGDRVGEENEIITGADSRVELTFDNQGVTRLGANAALTLKSKNVIELSRGALLLDFPGNNKGKVQAGAMSAVVSRATALLEYHPTVFKFLVLEGTTRLYRPARLGDSVLVHPGEMIFGNAAAPLTDPVNFDIERFVKTCPLVQNFLPLSNERLITAASERQQKAKSKRRLLDTNLVIFRGSSLVSVVNSSSVSAAPTPEPTRASASSRIPPPPSQEARP